MYSRDVGQMWPPHSPSRAPVSVPAPLPPVLQALVPPVGCHVMGLCDVISCTEGALCFDVGLFD